MQQVDTDPPSLPVGTEVSAKYKGAFCEAKVSKVVRNIKVKVAYKQGLGSGIVSDDLIKVVPGQLRVGATVEVRHPDRKDLIEATVTKIQDCSQYTVVFDDGDITTLRRTALCLKSGRHFNESETLDQLPLTHPEHFGNPVVGGRRGRRRGHLNEDSSEDEDESDTKEVVNEKEEHIGKVVCVETESKKKDKEKWFPGLVVAPTAQATVRIRVKDEYLVRSFKDGRYYTVPKKEANEFTRELAAKQDGQAVQAALEYMQSGALPPHWDREALFGLSNSSSDEDGELESDSSDDEPREEKDRFVAQLYKYMDDRGTPLNKVPSIQNRDVDLYRLFRAVQKRGGYNRVTTQNQWKSIAMRLGFTPVTVSVTNLVKQAFKKFLQPYGEFHRKLGCSMLMTPRNSNRSKGRSLVRANSVASPKPADNKETATNKITTGLATSSVSSSQVITVTSAPLLAATHSGTEESENTSESSLETSKTKRKTGSVTKSKGSLEKYEEKPSKDDGDVPLSKIKAAAVSLRIEDSEREKEKEVAKDLSGSVNQQTRESSPSGGIISNKREKYPRKPALQSDDKRGKRKKDDIAVEKIDLGDFTVEVGDKLKVYYHEKKVTYEAKVIDISVQRGPPIYLVHYTGWNNRYDEWVPRERIAENLTKGSKQKGRVVSSGQSEKPKENPPKPPTASSLTSTGSNSSTISGASGSTKIVTKRGRGRSDSLPPRSTTPSSVASNSSRTKSPATSCLKKRPTRSILNTVRRISVNVSDVSMPTESDTDSDEPVRRPTRGSKNTSTGKCTNKGKASVSAANSQSDTEDDDDEDSPSISLRGVASTGSTSNLNIKGRNYDLNQIRSELKGFQGLKSPSPACDSSAIDIKDVSVIKRDSLFEVKSKNTEVVISNSAVTIVEKVKVEPKEELVKSSTDISSETESFGDDDSQSSGKTTTLENMTKKFQQKINADKQRAMEKQSCGKSASERVPLVVEKIIQDSLAEKLQESLKAKPQVKKDENYESHSDNVTRKSENDFRDDSKKIISPVNEVKSSIIAPARFGGTSTVSTYSSVIVEKPIGSIRKSDASGPKKVDVSKKNNDALSSQQKKFIEPILKEVNKSENQTSSSPSSSSSSSSSSISISSRSLPDMSKLEISGNSSSTYSKSCKELKSVGVVAKQISPDIYEFKDPEPFEFEVRKPAIMSTIPSSVNAPLPSGTNTLLSSRKQSQKVNVQQNPANEYQIHGQNLIPTLSKKKRGSPMKETAAEKCKQTKIEDKSLPTTSEIKTCQHSPAMVPASLPLTKTISSTHSAAQSAILITSSQNQNVKPDPPLQGHRKSPSFNLNMNALDEELAQTVQAFQTPNVPPLHQTTPTKAATSTKVGSVNESLLPKPSTGNASLTIKTTIGSPFVETRKDLSNVFELSCGEGTSSNSESKDNKFELENAKILLSATVGAFDLDPTKYENKPTSIADKVLKAISQRKEEDKQKCENKSEIGKEKTELLSGSTDTFSILKETTEGTKTPPIIETITSSFPCEPLIINTDMPSTSIGLLSNNSSLGLEKFSAISAMTKRTPLSSPEPKIGILESITVKNDDLNETIQKLECAIQRKTPVTSQSVTTTPTPSLAPNTFSEDSMDSTDSERRLVIEDVADGQDDVRKSPISTQQVAEVKTVTGNMHPKLDTTDTKVICGNLIPLTNVKTPIPLKLIMQSGSSSISGSIPTDNLRNNASNNDPSAVISTIVTDPITPRSVQQMNAKKTSQPAKLDVQETSGKLFTIKSESDILLNASASENIIKEGVECKSNLAVIVTLPQNTISTATITSRQLQRITNVVPIVVPDIPVSVVVAPSAVPSVMAAAQAAVAEATAPLHNPKFLISKQSQQTPTEARNLLSVNASVSHSGNTSIITTHSAECNTQVQNVTNKLVRRSSPTLPRSGTGFIRSANVLGSSGFYLDAQADLRPDDGVKPIVDTERQSITNEYISNREPSMDHQSEELSSAFGGDVHNESINLLCEETIPGSPAPLYSGKDDLIPSQGRGGSLLEGESVRMCNASDCATTSTLHGTCNSSPNDSASQDESSEDIKKTTDIENEITPRKRRRTRKQSEIVNIVEQQSKRRRHMLCSKKNTAGSDSDDNSDTVSQRSTMSARQQFHQQVQLQQQPTSGIRPCPYNFLVKLDSSLSPDQCIAILLKQIQELRKTYNTIKGDLASIDRRRKKLRRREREKKQLQHQQQIKIGS